MAGRAAGVVTGEVSLAAATAAVALMLKAAANHSIEVVEFTWSFNGTDNTHEPVLVEVVHLSDDGTMTALTEQWLDDIVDDTIQTTAFKPDSGEPTVDKTLDEMYTHPQTGFKGQSPADASYRVKGGGRIGLQFTAPNAVKVRASAKWLE